MPEIEQQAIFFDFDGVLAESVNIKTEAFAKLYEAHGSDVVNMVIEYHLAHGGISRFAKFEHYHQVIHGRPPNDEEVEALARRFNELVEAMVIASDWVDGAEAFLEDVYRQVPMFVVSGTPEKELTRIIEMRAMSKYFRAVRGSPDNKTVILGDLLSAHALEAKLCAMIGDAMTDYDAAKAVGMPFVGRVDHGHESPFPAGTRMINDLNGLTLALQQLSNGREGD